MFTIFSCPKPFLGENKKVQIKAIRSWLLLNDPTPEIILIGNESGIVEFCNEINIRNIPDVKRNGFGTPLVNSIFEIGQREAANPIVCYINSDIVLTQSFSTIFRNVREQVGKFIVIGRRWDVKEVETEIDFLGQWQQKLDLEMKKSGRILHYGSDYFIFPKGLINNIPPFAIGRGIWDNWLIYFSIKNNFHVIDASESVRVIHQIHDYSHIKQSSKDLWKGIEGDNNKILSGKAPLFFNIDNATYRLTKAGIKFRFFVFLLNLLIKSYLRLSIGEKLILILSSINHRVTKRYLKGYFKLDNPI